MTRPGAGCSPLRTGMTTCGARSSNSWSGATWLGAINALRLALGTRLDVTEDDPIEIPDSDPRVGAYALYYYLGWLEEQVVAELAAGVDPAGTTRD